MTVTGLLHSWKRSDLICRKARCSCCRGAVIHLTAKSRKRRGVELHNSSPACQGNRQLPRCTPVMPSGHAGPLTATRLCESKRWISHRKGGQTSSERERRSLHGCAMVDKVAAPLAYVDLVLFVGVASATGEPQAEKRRSAGIPGVGAQAAHRRNSQSPHHGECGRESGKSKGARRQSRAVGCSHQSGQEMAI